MTFHYCKEGDSVLSIAREYGVSPVRLIEENGLSDPDRLAVGQCIVIYKSSRSYTVRGGDTFDGICKRFALDPHALLKFNPGIGEKRLLYPGQSLALGRVEAPFGSLSVCGRVSKNISASKLRVFASALTYLSIIDSDINPRSGCRSQKERELIDFSMQNRITPILCIRLMGDPKRLAEGIVKLGYQGVEIVDGSVRAEVDAYVREFKKSGLVVLLPYSEIGNGDGCDWTAIPFGDHRLSATERYASLPLDSEHSYRMMVELPYCGIEISCVTGKCIRTLPLSDCERLAYRRNTAIAVRENGKSYFPFHVTVQGRHEHREILFDDLGEIKKGLTILGESGICGISVYPEWCPRGLPTLLHRCFDVIKS